MSERARVDWDALEPHYRAGIRPLKEIGAEFGCSDAAIIKHAKQFAWTRNLTKKIQERAQAKVAAALVRAETQTEQPLTEEIRVEIESEVQARIQITHRKIIGQLREACEELIPKLAESEDLETRMRGVKSLAETVSKLVPLERQAYGIDKDTQPDSQEAAIEPLEGARRLAFALTRAAQMVH